MGIIGQWAIGMVLAIRITPRMQEETALIMQTMVSLFLVLILLYGCQNSALPRISNSLANRHLVASPQNVNTVDDLESIFTKEPSLSYLGYIVSKKQKTISVDGIKTEVSYALLKKET